MEKNNPKGWLYLLPAAGRAILELDHPETEAERLFLEAIKPLNKPIEPAK